MRLIALVGFAGMCLSIYAMLHAQSTDEALLGYVAFWVSGFCAFGGLCFRASEGR